ncbi:hypothetical protein [Chryseobacterium gambrini]|uniref:hypothetical protein n=1 Tax=Chryseobacterium gambrini TaxID=373672 RepID=UPI0022F1DD72|nr:hypothetical protein [Chryseobacterium gambrini]WBV50943.1 hypothetical protein PFY09_11425 [Chryseobacterium gambrini]
MKKMLFTAVLLAGTTLGFAKDNVKKNGTDVTLTENKTVTVVTENNQNEKGEDVFNCTMSFIEREYNNCGEYQGSYVESIELPSALCGDMDNGIIMHVSNINNGFGDCWNG